MRRREDVVKMIKNPKQVSRHNLFLDTNTSIAASRDKTDGFTNLKMHK